MRKTALRAIWIRWALALGPFWLMVWCADAAAADSVEYTVKAAYLVKFVPFIAWPDTAFAAPDQPLTICVLGPDPFGGKLDGATGQKVGDRAIAIKHVAAFDPAANCQLLFIAAAPLESEALAAVGTTPVVTVTDSGMTQPGVISFVLDANHVRFDIDDAAAAAAGVKISSKLLELAHAVKRRPPT